MRLKPESFPHVEGEIFNKWRHLLVTSEDIRYGAGILIIPGWLILLGENAEFGFTVMVIGVIAAVILLIVGAYLGTMATKIKKQHSIDHKNVKQ